MDTRRRSRSGSRHDAGAVWAAAAGADEARRLQGIIETRLRIRRCPAVRLLAESRAAGFEGSYTQLKAYVREVRPARSPEPVIRFETPAGRQA
jgi:transposase